MTQPTFCERTAEAYAAFGQREMDGLWAAYFVSWALARGLFTDTELRPVHTITCATNGEYLWFVLYHGFLYVRTARVQASAVDTAEAWDTWQRQQRHQQPVCGRRARDPSDGVSKRARV